MIPVIDLNRDFTSPSGEEGVKLREASEGLGCFRVINHGVSQKLMADMKSLAADLLFLPDGVKRKDKYVCNELGFLAPLPSSPHLESLGFFDASSSPDLDFCCSNLHLSPLQRTTMEKYAEEIHKTEIDVANKLAKSMGLDSDHLFEGWLSRLRLNKYNFSSDTVGTVGFMNHTDSGFITLLQDDDNVGGLELKDLSGQFVAVDQLPGSLIVFLGDTSVVWSNGRLSNMHHRVMCKEATKRYSIATLFIPPMDVEIQVPREFIDVDAGHPQLFSSVTYGELRQLRGDQFVAGQVLDLLRLAT